MKDTEIQSIKIDISTHEPTFFQKVMQCYHTMPKSWLLKRFRVDGGTIHIETLNDKIFSAQIKECQFRWQQDKYKRYEIWVKKENQKIHFKEIAYMCSDDEWNTIINFCLNAENSKETAASKIFSKVEVVKDILEGIS